MSLLVPYVGADPREIASYKAALKRRQKERDEAAQRAAIEQIAKSNEICLVRTQPVSSLTKAFRARAVIRECAKEFGLTREDIVGDRRFNEIAIPRQMAMYLIKKITEYSWPRIGMLLGGRDHTTIMWGYRQTEARMEADPIFAARVAEIEAKILGASNAAETQNV